jgi:predicted branched-subunit amino acid permease
MTSNPATAEVAPATWTRAGMRRGAKLGLPFAIGGFPWALGFGMLARS